MHALNPFTMAERGFCYGCIVGVIVGLIAGVLISWLVL